MDRRPPHLQLDLFGDAVPGPAPVPPEILRLASRLPPEIRLGTSSWSFPGWSGVVFDPAGNADETALARHGLPAYSRHPLFRTVGLDRTYYAPLSVADFAHYAAQVPDGFCFLVKAWRDLLAPSTLEETAWHRGLAKNPHYLSAEVAEAAVVRPAREGLGGKLGVLLFQFTPLRRRDSGTASEFSDRLAAFLRSLPGGPLYAVEIRSRELLTRSFSQALEAGGAVPSLVVHPSMAPLERQASICDPSRFPALVVRWMLGHGQTYEGARLRYQPFDRLVDEDQPTRQVIARLAIEAAAAGKPVFVIANNKAEGSAPLSLLGLAREILAQRPPRSAASLFD